MTTTPNASELKKKDCKPCHGKTPALPRDEAERLLKSMPNWHFANHGKSIERRWAAKDFRAAMEFLQKVTDLAEEQDHHPDLHLTGYRNVAIELSTHAIENLSENDFIMAAKIDEIPIRGAGPLEKR